MPKEIFWMILPVGAIVSWAINRWLWKGMYGYGIRKPLQPEHLRWTASPKPLTGGLGMAVVWLPMMILWLINSPTLTPIQQWSLWGFLGIATLTGLIDDLYHLNPWQKLAGQFMAAVLAYYGGWGMEICDIPVLDAMGSLLLMMGLLNSLNMLDNIDGVTGMTVLALVAALALGGNLSDPWLLGILLLGGAIVGFLHLNLYPSHIFMGDAGSHLLGAAVFMMIRIRWEPASQDIQSTIVLIYGMAFIPLTDTFMVTLSRLIRKKSPFKGGKDHLTHMLVYSGIRQSALPWILGLIQFFTALLVITGQVPLHQQMGVLGLLAAGMAWMYYRTWQRRLVPNVSV